MGTVKIPSAAGSEQTLAEVVRQFMEQGLAFSVTLVRGDWIIEVTGY